MNIYFRVNYIRFEGIAQIAKLIIYEVAITTMHLFLR